MSADSNHNQGHGEHHVMPLSTYFAVFGALLVLTGITVLVSFLKLGLLVAVVIASIKAALVVGYFMHLKYDDRFYSVILLSSLFAIFCFFLFVFLDFTSRGMVVPEEETNFLRNERAMIERLEQEEAAAAAAAEEEEEEEAEEDTGG
ncbi:MAG: hypothetical protein EA398_05155 [Deltaproteobacteria bacterium]|nr:MAG: hypothetical protein EA398_05155 [Deltaproteobacteria bacterium]